LDRPRDSNKKTAARAAAIYTVLSGMRVTEKLERVKEKVVRIREIQ
jgi:hypothetical protein